MFRRPPAKEIWEAKAAELVGEVLGGEFTQYDDGSQDGMVDFIGQTQVGQIALEVTSTVDGHTLALTDDLRPPEGLADHLQYEWRFTVPWGAGRPSKRGFWPALLHALEDLEKELDSRNLELFGGTIGPEEESLSPHVVAIRLLRGVGFIQGSAVRAEASSCGAISVGFGGFMAPGDPLRAVRAALDGNRRKLVAVPADERHLFIWVHDTQLAMTDRLLLDIGPHDSMELQGVDQVWLAPWQENTGVGMLLPRTWVLREGAKWNQAQRITDI